MAITPDHGHCIVALCVHVGWVNVFRDGLNLEYLASVDFVDAPGATASKTQFVRRNFLDEFASLVHMYQTLLGIKVDFGLRTGLVKLLNFVNYLVGQLVIYLDDVCLLRQGQHEWSA